jgi:WhiB family redox-sensing transcriptional regulator
MTAPDWMGRGACVGVDPAVMFPHPTDHAGLRTAQSYCATCKVIDECAAYAAEYPGMEGVWAGRSLTRRGRAAERRTQRRTERSNT